jgi:hypothetical protein
MVVLAGLSLIDFSSAARAEQHPPFVIPSPDLVHPPMTDQQLFERINLDHPGLEHVRSAVQAGDLPSAKAGLAAYYRARTGVFHTFDPDSPVPPSQSADRLLRAARPAIERTGSFDPQYWTDDGWYDFEASPVRHGHRMYYFESLGRAAALDDGDDAAHALITLVRSFAHQFHSPPERGRGMWASMNTGIRMRTGWPVAFLALLRSPHFTGDDIILLLKSVWDQTDHLRRFHSETSNWLTFEMAGLYTSGVVYPEFIDADEWRGFATDTAIQDIARGWLPDGMTIELSPGYGTFFSNYYIIHDLAQHVGRHGESDIDQLVPLTEPLFELYLKIMAPDRLAPATNDNAHADVLQVLRSALDRLPDREDFRWAVTDGKEGRPPDYTSILLPYAGFAAMRSGWSRQDHMLYFDFGPVGYRHAHQDGLNVILWSHGRQILFDPGLVNYDHADPMVNYAMDTFSHNTVLVDHRPQRRPWYDNPHPRRMPYQKLENFRWESTDQYDFAAGVYDQAYGLPGPSNAYPYSEDSNFRHGWGHPATHHRRVYFHKPDLFLVADTLTSMDGQAHDYDLRWHLDSTSIRSADDGVAIATIDEHLPNLEIVPLFTEGLQVRATSAQRAPEILGWNAANPEELRPATTVQHLKTGPDTVRFLTLLLPLHDTASRLRSHERIDDSTVIIELTDGRRMTITVPDDPWETLAVTEQ